MVNIPNVITIIRAVLVPVFITALHYKNFKIALIVFLVAAVSDAVDGFLARKLKQITMVGTIIDPLADKALIDSGFVVLSFTHKIIPAWLTILVLSRDTIIIVGGWLLTVLGKIEKIKPILLGKLTSFSQFSTIFFTLLYLNFHSFYLELFLKFLYPFTGGMTAISGISYILKGYREIENG
ncbi:CDP-alcohol phosphatidyltransferase family protein [Desulfurobacterium atlanticum]|uniref:CDP-diacylglycerol--glycerol-3-phosphate 3-phosphatidyltransferase n=1 Tax=Desulfurobacterium atlanticum TaxID=240169 RepID=A0A238XQ94_9BACT|nr:CDP-alcohol phosphatidyltransferase family protein [Desulfurobacterium atlanticum]SNR61145.1 cardiolipin synthase [Desulfurobacterium atlanticum]